MKTIEVTGIPGVGKSYIINIMSKNKNIILDTTLIEKHHLYDIKLINYFFMNKNTLLILSYIIKVAYLLDISIFNKLNFIRNSIKKIGKDYFFKYKLQDKDKKIILVDEGIIHLYQNIVSSNQDDIQPLLSLIHKIVTLSNFSNKIILIDAEDSTIIKRLKERGHLRLKNKEKINKFVEKSRKNIFFLRKNYSVTTIYNNKIDNKDIKDIINGIL